jgi:chemotaxis methyl-accepting protein methylase
MFMLDTQNRATYFFRNAALWRLVAGELLPRLTRARRDAGQHALCCWSAAASDGAETYSLAGLVHDALVADSAWEVRIIGTDVCEAALAQARLATYNEFSLRALDHERRRRFFEHLADGRYRVRGELRRLVSFERHDVRHPFARDRFDMVLLRNVLPHFDAAARHAALASTSDSLREGGYLVVGDVDPLHGEPSIAAEFDLSCVRACVYRKGGR